MANNKNPNQKQPGEKEPGKFHYNPGNMSGKTIGTNEPQQRETLTRKKAVASTKIKSAHEFSLWSSYRSTAPTLWHLAHGYCRPMKHRT